ncbi:unnamed protein product [Peronospora destructor]|uniref:Cilium assembly protein DZIP1 N-terminal domain-containing protein n=1 Tax=Peronospora destructor TaxID=86335 RepID=A0AAV0SWL0_9STRA|nr:unnamed protein product [Peronospora destructor]
MQRFCWRERSEKLNWRLLSTFNVSGVVRRGDPAVLEPYALHVTFARLPAPSKDPPTRDAWFLVRILQLSMEYLLFMRANASNKLKFLSQELRQVEKERDVLLLRSRKWKAKIRSGDEQVEKLHRVLQRIATLLQSPGASPSVVATIATLLTQLVSERPVKQMGRILREEDDSGDEIDKMLRSTGPEARVSGFYEELFSSVEFLEKHLGGRHSGESIKVETPAKQKMRRTIDNNKENTEKSVVSLASEATMQKMVQRVEQALQQHEEKLHSLAREEAQKIKQMYEQLHSEAKLASEYRCFQMRAEVRHQEVQRHLDEVYLQKQKADGELADLKKQIQFLTLKRKMMEALANADVPTTLPYKSDDALGAVETEINDLQQKPQAVKAELTASTRGTDKSPSLTVLASKGKKELPDTLALSRGVVAVVKRDQSAQIELPVVIHKAVQTDEGSSSHQSTSQVLIESCASILKDVGADPLALTYDHVGIPTVGGVEPPRMDVIDELDLVASSVAPERISQESMIVEARQVAEDAAPSKPIMTENDKRIPNHMHQIHRQDLLNIIAEHAQSAASKATNHSLASKNCSSIPQHIRSQFQHDEDLVKKRVKSCLLQLEQFARRFGVSARSAWLSEDNVQTAQQALHGHLEVLPTDVLTKMVECENTVNAIIEKEWESMEKTRQQVLQSMKLKARATSEAL